MSKEKERQCSKKAWNDKIKGKKDQRQEVFKPPFFRNNSQANQQG
jgi:hypothetical protein